MNKVEYYRKLMAILSRDLEINEDKARAIIALNKEYYGV